MVAKHLCSICGSQYHYQTFCPFKKHKPISQNGKKKEIYESFKHTVAIPYLDKKYGHVCSVRSCEVTNNLDIDHIKTRGARADLKMDVKNLRYLCRPHHRLITDGEHFLFKKR